MTSCRNFRKLLCIYSCCHIAAIDTECAQLYGVCVVTFKWNHVNTTFKVTF
jgi:hypothetical protein